MKLEHKIHRRFYSLPYAFQRRSCRGGFWVMLFPTRPEFSIIDLSTSLRHMLSACPHIFPISLSGWISESTQALTPLHGLPPWHCLSPSQKKKKLGGSETNCPIPKLFLVYKISPPGPHPTRTTMMMVRAMIRHQNMLTPCPTEYLAYQQILMVLSRATVKTGPIIT